MSKLLISIVMADPNIITVRKVDTGITIGVAIELISIALAMAVE